MRAYLPLLFPCAAVLLTACGGTGGHAHVDWGPGGKNPTADWAAYYASAAYRLQREDPRIPEDYDEFRRISMYPITYKVWKKPALLHARGEKLVKISIADQRGMLYVNGEIAMDFPVCTGKDDRTPRGSFRVLEKQVHHTSNIYHVSMPYFMRLTYDGIGMHVGYVGRDPLSHGCIRIPKDACMTLYSCVTPGTPVEVE